MYKPAEVYELSRVIVKTYQHLFAPYPDGRPADYGLEIGPGWFPLMERMLEELDQLDPKLPDEVRIDTVKEKWGALRIYMTTSTDQTDEITERAMEDSAYICDVCGDYATIANDGGWLSARCAKHRKT